MTARLYSAGGKYWVQLKDALGGVGHLPGRVLLRRRPVQAALPHQHRRRAATCSPSSTTSTRPAGGKPSTRPTPLRALGLAAVQRPERRRSGISAPPGASAPPKSKAFDNNCAGCHFTGYKLTGDATDGLEGPRRARRERRDGLRRRRPARAHEHRAARPAMVPAPITGRHAGQGKLDRHPAPAHAGARGHDLRASATPARSASAAAPRRTRSTRRQPMVRRHQPRASGWRTTSPSSTTGCGTRTRATASTPRSTTSRPSDFLKSVKYRNQFQLVTCSSCHDPHGTGEPPPTRSNAPAQGRLDAAPATAGLCLGCHTHVLPGGRHGRRPHPGPLRGPGHHQRRHGRDIHCAKCHMPKTAKSGSGLKQADIAGQQYLLGRHQLAPLRRAAEVGSGGQGGRDHHRQRRDAHSVHQQVRPLSHHVVNSP